ncbi:MAG: hypothetical protein ACXAD7_19190 [Candidatus Kariarchaeaceae archaeon]|jgi:hypothetical protein
MTIKDDSLVYEKAKHSVVNDSLTRIALQFQGKERKHLRYWAILHLDDEETLEKVALYDDLPAIRMEAVKKINKPKLLIKIAIYDVSLDVRILAVKQIQDVKSLLLLRLQADADLQPFISHKLNEMNQSDENSVVETN